MSLGAAPAWPNELPLRASERGQASRRLARDEFLEASVYESGLLRDAGQLGSLPHEVVPQGERGSHGFYPARRARNRTSASAFGTSEPSSMNSSCV